jgi:hypothetical protein
MKAFHGDEAVKQKYLARLKAHHEADEIIQGTGWENGHGCAVGCTLNKYDHVAYEHELGLPQWLARLQDVIFEGLPVGKAQQFAVDFLAAVPIGADVSEVRFKLASARGHKTREAQTANPAAYAKQCVAAIDLVIAYCDDPLRTEIQRSAAWSAAESAAAAAAAWSAAESAAAAWSARSAAARSAAVESAAVESAESARSDHYEWEAATLLELLRNAPQAVE